MVIIREYQSGDLESITELMSDLGYPTNKEVMHQRLERIENNPNYETFVAEVQGVVVGLIGVRQLLAFEVDDVITQIIALVIKSEFQRKGIGSALIQHVEEWSKQHGSNVLVLTSGIKEERKKAHAFYQTLGFDITGYRFVKRITNLSSKVE